MLTYFCVDPKGHPLVENGAAIDSGSPEPVRALENLAALHDEPHVL